MLWNIVGQKEQYERIRITVSEQFFGPLVITGAAGSGRSTVLTTVVRELGSSAITVRMAARNGAPFATLRTVLSARPDTGATIVEVAASLARVLAERARGVRCVVVVDDAHLADQASLLALRVLSRNGVASLVLTWPDTPDRRRAPDPTDCLRYEPGTRVVELTALSEPDVALLLAGLLGEPAHPATAAALHAASGGNPRVLHDLVIDGGLVDGIVRQGPARRLREPDDAGRGMTLARADAGRLVDAVRDAWRELALDRVEELCRLAGWYGISEHVATIAATTALLRGRPEQCARILDTVTPSAAASREHWILARAMCVGLGGARVDAAAGILEAAAQDLPAACERLAAYRAWLLAVTGRPDSHTGEPGASLDREATLFTQAALAAAALRAGRPTEAIAHLRRALITSAGCRDTVPWMAPLMTATLIDALLIAGRISEATTLASEFHAGNPLSGWTVAVAISALVNATLGTSAQRTREVEAA